MMKCHLTEDFQAKAADSLIKKLKYKIGEHESYIQELEYNNKSLRTQLEAAQGQIKVLLDKYSRDTSELLKEPILAKLQEEKKELEKRVKSLITIRDNFLYQLNSKDDE